MVALKIKTKIGTTVIRFAEGEKIVRDKTALNRKNQPSQNLFGNYGN
jgi:hypothetical protein